MLEVITLAATMPGTHRPTRGVNATGTEPAHKSGCMRLLHSNEEVAMASHRPAVLVVLASAMAAPVLSATAAFAQTCPPQWDARFAELGADGEVWALIEFDDGSGPALYAGGDFSTIAGERAWGLARWDGRHWSEVGGGVARGGDAGIVYGLAVWDDGNGPALFVGGFFESAGGVAANHVARWDGQEWSALGAGTDHAVQCLATYDDGRGEALYCGGPFRRAGGVALTSYIARWDGRAWEPLGDGLYGGVLGVTSLTAFDDGHGPSLFVGGSFTFAGAMELRYFGRWDGQAWTSPGEDQITYRSPGYPAHIDEMVAWDDGRGPALFLTGEFEDGQGNECIVRWDGQTFEPLPGLHFGSGHADAIAVHDDGSGEALYIGSDGAFRLLESSQTSTVGKWNGERWTALSSYPVSYVFTLRSFNDGFGPALYAGGLLRLMEPEREPINHIVRWAVPHMALMHTPLRAGRRAVLSTTCSTPGERTYFISSTRGLGSFFVPQLNVTLDLDQPHLAGSSIADEQGKASLIRTLPPGSSGRPVFLQAVEQGRKSEVGEAVIE